MNKIIINELIAQKEGYKIEFKQNADKSIAKEVCAFANSSGGRILIGITDSGVKKGINVNNKLLSQIQDSINSINPKIDVRIEEIDQVLIIEVPEGIFKPYECAEGYFKRIGANSQKLKRDEIVDLFKKEGKIRFDELANDIATLSKDFDERIYQKFFKQNIINSKSKKDNLLRNLRCINNNKFTNAGALFFCKSIEFIVPHAIVTCVLYKGITKVHVLDRKDFTGSITANIDESIAFIMRHIDLEYKIEHTRREEIPEIPEVAIREAVINALSHRDYFNVTINTIIEVFDDRVEITNPGGLANGLNKRNFKTMSVARNPILCDLLRRAGYVEKIGTGISRIEDAVKERGNIKVRFELNENYFKVIFSRKSKFLKFGAVINPDQLIGANHLTQQLLSLIKEFPPLNEDARYIPNQPLNKLSEQMSEQMSEQIWALIKNNPKITAKIISVELNLSSRTVERYISLLKECGRLERIGSNKSGFWRIIN